MNIKLYSEDELLTLEIKYRDNLEVLDLINSVRSEGMTVEDIRGQLVHERESIRTLEEQLEDWEDSNA